MSVSERPATWGQSRYIDKGALGGTQPGVAWGKVDSQSWSEPPVHVPPSPAQPSTLLHP